MFTGIIEEMGLVRSIVNQGSGKKFEIEAPTLLADAQLGDSISVNGCCLTLISIKKNIFTVEAVEETLKKTNLSSWRVDDKVNLERSLRMQSRLGGHIVQGHVDGMGVLKKKEALSDGSFMISIESQPHLLRYMIEKGSIAVDGISLTLVNVDERQFSIAIIPHTAKMTTLGIKSIGAQLNLEVDLIAKYAEKLIHPYLSAKK